MSPKGKRRVVITGMGAVTPLGTGVENTWENLLAGKSGVSTISIFDPSGLPTTIAGEVREFNPEEFIPAKDVRRMDRYIHYGVAAARLALNDSRLNLDDTEVVKRTGVATGVGFGGMSVIERTIIDLHSRGPRKVSPFFVPSVIANMVSGYISLYFNLHGPNLCSATACAAGAHAIGDAFRLIKSDAADIMFTGGAESCLARIGIAGFCAARALSRRNDEPHRASRPFDKDRDGFVLSDGAGILILEEHDHAVQRGAHIYAEIIGFGVSADAHHITVPSPDGEWGAVCMNRALEDARLSPSEVDYINAHGTSTDLGDVAETNAIKRTFGKHAYSLNISSTKSSIGHLLGASGAVEAIFTTLALEKGIIPQTINLDNPDPACDLNYTPHKPVRKKLNYALSNSFGFGGTNASLLFKRYEN